MQPIIISLLLCFYVIHVISASALKDERSFAIVQPSNDQNWQPHGLEKILRRAQRNAMQDDEDTDDYQQETTTIGYGGYGLDAPLCLSFGCDCVKPKDKPCCDGYKYDRRSKKCKENP